MKPYPPEHVKFLKIAKLQIAKLPADFNQNIS
jgi:hypothetical protein